jgi:hypothetical protein
MGDNSGTHSFNSFNLLAAWDRLRRLKLRDNVLKF